MTVTGTQQRVYGKLIGDCYIDLNRFAISYGSYNSPDIASVAFYGGDTSHAKYKMCGASYDGYITLLFINNSGTIFAAIEAKYCESGDIELWAYRYATISSSYSFWFKLGTEWQHIGNVPASSTSAYFNVTYTKFEESAPEEDSIYLEQCEECQESNICKTCTTPNIFIRYRNAYRFGSVCCNKITLDINEGEDLSHLIGNYFYIVYSWLPAYTLYFVKVIDVEDDVITIDFTDFTSSSMGNSYICTIDTLDVDTYATYNYLYQEIPYTLLIYVGDFTGGTIFNLDLSIEVWRCDKTTYADIELVPLENISRFQLLWASPWPAVQIIHIIHDNPENNLKWTNYDLNSWNKTDSTGYFSMQHHMIVYVDFTGVDGDGSTYAHKVKYKIHINSIKDNCTNTEHIDQPEYICLKWFDLYAGNHNLLREYPDTHWYPDIGTESPSSIVPYGYSGNGTYTALFNKNSFIEYSFDCDAIDLWTGDITTHTTRNELYYTDPDGVSHLLDTRPEGYSESIVEKNYDYNYIENCTTRLATVTQFCLTVIKFTNSVSMKYIVDCGGYGEHLYINYYDPYDGSANTWLEFGYESIDLENNIIYLDTTNLYHQNGTAFLDNSITVYERELDNLTMTIDGKSLTYAYTLGSVYIINMYPTFTISGYFEIDPDSEPPERKTLINPSTIKGIITTQVWYAYAEFPLTYQRTSDTRIEIPEQTIKFSGFYGTTSYATDLFTMNFGISIIFPFGYEIGYNSLSGQISWKLDKIEDICGYATFYPPYTNFKTNPLAGTWQSSNNFKIESSHKP